MAIPSSSGLSIELVPLRVVLPSPSNHGLAPALCERTNPQTPQISCIVQKGNPTTLLHCAERQPYKSPTLCLKATIQISYTVQKGNHAPWKPCSPHPSPYQQCISCIYTVHPQRRAAAYFHPPPFWYITTTHALPSHLPSAQTCEAIESECSTLLIIFKYFARRRSIR
jgi:hypothetical protein